MNSETLKQELDTIADACQQQQDTSNIEAVLEHGMYLSSQLPRVASIKADALKFQRAAELIKIDFYREYWKSPMVLNKLVAASTGEEQALVELADSVFSSIKHQMDFYRSVISKYKEELSQNRGYQQQ